MLAAFGLVGSPVMVRGRQGTAWRVGEAVVKPLDTAALRPVAGRSLLFHDDLTGNVLFHDALPPPVIDLSPY